MKNHRPSPPELFTEELFGPHHQTVGELVWTISWLSSEQLLLLASLVSRVDDPFDAVNEGARIVAERSVHIPSLEALEEALGVALRGACEREGLGAGDGFFVEQGRRALLAPLVVAALGSACAPTLLIGFAGAAWSLLFGEDLLSLLAEAEEWPEPVAAVEPPLA